MNLPPRRPHGAVFFLVGIRLCQPLSLMIRFSNPDRMIKGDARSPSPSIGTPPHSQPSVLKLEPAMGQA